MEILSCPPLPISTSNQSQQRTEQRPQGEEQKRGKRGKQEGMAADAAIPGRGKKLPPILLHVLLLLAVIPRIGAAPAAPACNGSDSVAAGCPIGGGEAGVETIRRVLAGYGGGHIAYDALERQAWCGSPRGAAYTQGHGCLPQRVNPHTRPCLTIYNCRS